MALTPADRNEIRAIVAEQLEKNNPKAAAAVWNFELYSGFESAKKVMKDMYRKIVQNG